MKTYKIIGKTNGYIANRDILFNGKCDIDIETGLTLKEAQKNSLTSSTKITALISPTGDWLVAIIH